MNNRIAALVQALAVLSVFGVSSSAAEDPLLTVAEKSGYKATSRHSEVVDFCEKLGKMSPLVRLGELGTTNEGRKLPLVIIADPPVPTPEEAATSGKLVVFAIGNIHAGEVDGKEGLLMLARDLVNAKDRPLLRNLIVVIAPIFNADGNERMSKTNRPGQLGPDDGMGIRENAQGFDLNRDFIKLESPEVRGLVRFFNKWNPAIFIDCHTTNGSYHRYTITYEGPRNPAGDKQLVEAVRVELFPDLDRRMEMKGGWKTYFYGNFSRDKKLWETVPPTPRYSIHYVGLRNRIGILSESYSYASYKDRVLASRDFVQSIFEYAAENKDKVGKLLTDARERTVKAGTASLAGNLVPLRVKDAPAGNPANLLSYEVEQRNGKRFNTGTPKEFSVQYMGRGEPTLSVVRPHAYLIPAGLTKIVEALQRHGIAVEEVREDAELDVEVYQCKSVKHESYPFQLHKTVTVDATSRKESRKIAAGTFLVKTAQPLGSLAVYLLEPQSEDGLTTWNFFDESLVEGKDFPVLRLKSGVPEMTAPVQPLREKP